MLVCFGKPMMVIQIHSWNIISLLAAYATIAMLQQYCRSLYRTQVLIEEANAIPGIKYCKHTTMITIPTIVVDVALIALAPYCSMATPFL